MHSRIVRIVAVALLGCSLAACIPPETTDQRGGDREEPTKEDVDLSEYEDFDPAPYAEEAPAAREEIEHDVPARLLSGQADEGVERTVRGYRVQVLSTKDQSAAERAAAEAEQWWSKQASSAPSDLFSGDGMPVHTVYRQPYYRVRVGNFTSRSEAERALQFLSPRYGDAFIVRDDVTVTQ